jgi:uncharacterized protein (DUF58 family)
MESLEGIAVPVVAELVALRHSARYLALFPRQQARATSAGQYRSRFRGRGMDFDEVRPYQAGDDIRTIDWRVTAKTTIPHTKIFREERERPVLLAVDLRSDMFFGSRRLKSLTATDVAVALAWAGIRSNDRLGAMIFSPDQQRDIRGRRSHHNVLQFIHALVEACTDLLRFNRDQYTLNDILENVRRACAPGTSVAVISDFHDLDRDSEKHLFELARHNDVTLIEVTDPLELELPPPGMYPVTDGSQRIQLDAGDSRLREQFRKSQQQRRQWLQSTATKQRLSLLSFSTRDDIVAKLIRHYGQRQKTGGGR